MLTSVLANNRCAIPMRRRCTPSPHHADSTKVKALAESSNWGELDRFSKSKKSPIGYEPFVTECIAKGNRFEAKKYVVKMAPDERVPYYCKVQAWEEAVTTAVGLKNEEQLELIQQACGGRRDVMKMIADRTGGGGR